MLKRNVLPAFIAGLSLFALSACAAMPYLNPNDPGQRALGGAMVGAGSGAAIGGAVGGWDGAAVGAAVGGVVGAVTGAATTPTTPMPGAGYTPPPG
jgi:hypothetical protein